MRFSTAGGSGTGSVRSWHRSRSPRDGNLTDHTHTRTGRSLAPSDRTQHNAVIMLTSEEGLLHHPAYAVGREHRHGSRLPVHGAGGCLVGYAPILEHTGRLRSRPVVVRGVVCANRAVAATGHRRRRRAPPRHCEAAGSSPASIRRRLAALASFFEYSASADETADNPAAGVARPDTTDASSTAEIDETRPHG